MVLEFFKFLRNIEKSIFFFVRDILLKVFKCYIIIIRESIRRVWEGGNCYVWGFVDIYVGWRERYL